jgi:hypothetical protein
MRLTESQYKSLLGKKIDYKQSKYKNKKVSYDGFEFDSQKERNYYIKLKTLEELGLIKNLELQKEYILQDKFILNGKTRRKITYKADFSYISTEDDKLHVVDVKGFKTEVYKLKKKLFEYKYQTELEEI